MKSSATPIKTDFQAILDSINDGVMTVTRDHVVTFFNRAAEIITGVPLQEAIGRKCFEVMRAETCETQCSLRQTMTNGESCENVPVYIIRADNKRILISVNTNVIRDVKGRISGGVEIFRDLSEIDSLRREFHKKHTFENIVSKNHKMIQLFSVLPQIAESRSTVLIEGPSGSGKELVARAIHNQGLRKNKPFVAVNCGALPDTLIESELFGYKAGAFTDAKRDKPGRFTQAGKGTIFLDEIGDISPAVQVRLLRVLEKRSYSPLGGTESMQMKARVIAATHRDLQKMVERSEFREDLYFRINVVRLKLPQLADRKEDIPLLVDHFVERFKMLTGNQIVGVTDDAMAALALYSWPGNVRELENAIEHAFVLCRDQMIGIPHLPEQVRPHNDQCLATGCGSLREQEKQIILNALIRNGWRPIATARELQIHKNTLRRKILQFGICRS
jgi:sigma-54 dependent transcriptional regulator, acetoin dehydrogenase operon transcriptional activator AcoR